MNIQNLDIIFKEKGHFLKNPNHLAGKGKYHEYKHSGRNQKNHLGQNRV